MLRPALLAPVLLLAACTQFPELDRATSARAEAADYPALVPLDPLLAGARPAAAADPAPALEARVEALRARAAALRSRTIIDAQTRARMARGAG